ncbi:hypothetical protein [Actinoplanes sp. NPDC049265]|uniref:hypothetical protein n=1 Tax=Actinoplanes sp. NPDC049265 TaxID=3363902 RepID=UPI00371410B4
MRDLLHRATHRIPGVPPHAGRPGGHQRPAGRPAGHRWNHSPDRPPRFLPGWQRRIAAFFGQEV